MPRTFEFNSAIGHHIQGFLDEKQLLGYKYYNESKWMEKFDIYWQNHGYGNTGLTAENLEEWMQKRDSEQIKCQVTRISIIREFSIYLNGLGIMSYYPPIDVHYNKAQVHVFNDEEIKELFETIDNYMPKKGSIDCIRIANEYPVLYRLILCEGLRNSEASQLLTENINFEKGTITVLNSKGKKDRIVYLSSDVLSLCKDYYDYLCKELGHDSKYFFPGLDSENPLHSGSVSAHFRAMWLKTSFAESCLVEPCVHSLRHTMITKRINLWLQQGISFEHMIPYLCKFLGHKDYNDTFYYFHYVEETARFLRERDTTTKRVIPDVTRR